MAAANYAFAMDKPADLIGNYDATQFIVSNRNNELLARVADPDEDIEVLTLRESSTLDQAVKWLMLCNAAGKTGQDVFLIADPSLNEGEMMCHKIPGLNHSDSSNSDGYLCVSRTISGNKNFFRWYFQEFVQSFLRESRRHFDKTDVDISFYLGVDGEELQIRPVEDDDIFNMLCDNEITLVKCPASFTGTIGNACNRSEVFKASKRRSRAGMVLYPPIKTLERVILYKTGS